MMKLMNAFVPAVQAVPGGGFVCRARYRTAVPERTATWSPQSEQAKGCNRLHNLSLYVHIICDSVMMEMRKRMKNHENGANQ